VVCTLLGANHKMRREMVTLNGFLFGCALVVIVGVKVLVSYIAYDPCKGDGNFRKSNYFYYEKEEDETEDEN